MRASPAFPALAVLLLAAPAAAAPSAAAPSAAAPDLPVALAVIGRQIFFDARLSASGRLACASCHSPSDAYGPPGGGAAPRGGARLDRPPLRTVPSLRYLDRTPRFTRHYYLERGDEVEDEGPAGGFMRDGRADSLHAQALIPWLGAGEMANESIGALARRLRSAHGAQLE